MNIQEITNRSLWQQFFEDAGSPSFLQSWEWGEMEEKMGYKTLRLGVYNQGNLEAIALVIKTSAKRGRFLFVPHGPIFSNLKSQISNLKSISSYLIKLAKQENCSFVRIAPTLKDTENNKKIFLNFGFRQAPIYMHAERLWVLDITKTEEQLLSEMRKTSRYLIRKAERDGVVIEKRTDPQALDDFWKIYEETAKREKFVPFSKNFIKAEFEAFNKTGNALFLFGKIKNQATSVETLGLPTERRDPSIFTDGPRAPDGKNVETRLVASALIIFTKSTAFYHQGASFHTKVPVTYLLQWEAIREAKKRGCQLYNFWGTLLPGRTPKSWTGLTLFKQGFGGQQIDYLSTQDYIISKKYYLTYLWEKFLSWRRGV